MIIIITFSMNITSCTENKSAVHGLFNCSPRLVYKTCKYEVAMCLRQQDCFPLQRRTGKTQSVQPLWADDSAYKSHTSPLADETFSFEYFRTNDAYLQQ